MFWLPALLLFSSITAHVNDYFYTAPPDSTLNHKQYTIYNLEPYGKYYIDNPKDCLKRRIVQGIADEPEVLNRVLELTKPNMTVLDVGAHIGTFSIPIAKKLAGTGHLYSFEPQKKLVCELAHNLELNNCHGTKILNVALGDQIQTVRMCSPMKNNEGAGFIGKGGELAQMVTLDSLNLGKVDLIKIDVENSEYLVLLGARETILRDRPTIIMEIGGNRRKRAFDRIGGTTHHNRVMKLMNELGYDNVNLSWKNFIFTPKEENS